MSNYVISFNAWHSGSDYRNNSFLIKNILFPISTAKARTQSVCYVKPSIPVAKGSGVGHR